jgi:hypothetical protein
MKKKILYLKTDIITEELIAGGSVTHTIGVIKGFTSLGYTIICATSAIFEIMHNLPILKLYKLKNPSCLKFLRWKVNCFLSNIFFMFCILKIIFYTKLYYVNKRKINNNRRCRG